MKKLLILFLLPFFVLIEQTNVSAQPGALDPSFGNGGLVSTFVASRNDRPFCSALQPDGKILVAGLSYYDTINNDYGFALVRYTTDGILDTTFSGDGKVNTIVNGSISASAYAIAIQPDFKILLTGFATIGSSNKQVIVRYHANGIVDSTFGMNGIVTTAIGTIDDRSTSMLLQNDSKIVLAGYSKNLSGVKNFSISRYDSTGVLDTTFSNDGINTTPFNGNNVYANSVAMHQNGNYYVFGTVYSISTYYYAMARYFHNGTLDLSFGSSGIKSYSVGTGFNDYGSKILIQPDGKLLLFGQADVGASKMCVLRLDSNAVLDPTFNSSGKVIIGQGINYITAGDIALQPDGKIVITGTIRNGTDYNFILARIKSNGVIDSTFGTNGIVTTVFSTNSDFAYSVIIQPDEKIVVVGITEEGPVNKFALARYFGDLSVGLSSTPELPNEIELYPNPISNKLNIQLNDVEQTEICIYDLSARKLFHQVFTQSISINTEQFANGIYICQLINKRGIFTSRKIIKE